MCDVLFKASFMLYVEETVTAVTILGLLDSC